jgi:hypothetical protein
MHVPSFPPTVPRSGASLPSPRSGWARSRASAVRSRRYDFLPPVAPHFVAFAWRYHTVRLVVRSHRPSTQWRWTGSTLIGHPQQAESSRWRRQDLPSSWETPIASMPGSATPAGPHAPHCHDGAAARPPLRERRRLPHWDFRSSMAWPRSSLSTLRRLGYPNATQDSLPGAGQALLYGLGYPQGFYEKFPRYSLHRFPLSQAYLAQSPFLIPLSVTVTSVPIVGKLDIITQFTGEEELCKQRQPEQPRDQVAES